MQITTEEFKELIAFIRENRAEVRQHIADSEAEMNKFMADVFKPIEKMPTLSAEVTTRVGEYEVTERYYDAMLVDANGDRLNPPIRLKREADGTFVVVPM